VDQLSHTHTKGEAPQKAAISAPFGYSIGALVQLSTDRLPPVN